MTRAKKKSDEVSSATDVASLVTAMQQLMAENKILQSKLDVYQDKAPLVGVVWYGDGRVSLHLKVPVNQETDAILHRYGAKSVIDVKTWKHAQKYDFVKSGVLVRDDRVIDELGVVGEVAPPDSWAKNPNAFTDDVIEKVLCDYKTAEAFVNQVTHHFAVFHVNRVAEALGKLDPPLKDLFRRRYDYLMLKDHWNRTHDRELMLAAENRDIPFDKREREDVIQDIMDSDARAKGLETI